MTTKEQRAVIVQQIESKSTVAALADLIETILFQSEMLRDYRDESLQLNARLAIVERQAEIYRLWLTQEG